MTGPRTALGAILNTSAPILTDAIENLVRATARQVDQAGAYVGLAEAIADTAALADLLGRVSIANWARERMEPSVQAASARISGSTTDVVPKIPFAEAVRWLESQDPMLAGSAEEVRNIYSRGHGFALAQSSSLAVTKRVQREIQRAMVEGTPRGRVERAIARLGDWSRAYAALVYRNNVARAYAAGKHAMAEDKRVRSVLAGLLFAAVMDLDTTPICRGMNGTFAPPGHPIWASRTTPTHHGCRSDLVPVDKHSARGMRLMDASGQVRVRIPNPKVMPEPGFGGRPSVATGVVA